MSVSTQGVLRGHWLRFLRGGATMFEGDAASLGADGGEILEVGLIPPVLTRSRAHEASQKHTWPNKLITVPAAVRA